MTEELDTLDQITHLINSLNKDERLIVGNCIMQIRFLIEQHKELAILAIAFVGAELAAK